VESLKVKLFAEHEIPWNEIAFAVVRNTLENYFADLKTGEYPVRMFDVTYSPERKVDIALVSSSKL
jgi:hypothetical protein